MVLLDLADVVGLDLKKFENIKNYILEKKYLVIVGPEKPFRYGLVDFLEKDKIKVFGPNKLA